MGYYLLDNKPASTQFYSKRRNGGKVTGTYDVHTFESFPDWVGPDTGVENAVGYLRTRKDPGSYHDAVDSDSHIPVVPWWYEAFHDRFTNNWALSVSIATQAHKWGSAPKEWRTNALRRAAIVAAKRADEVYACTDLNKVASLKIDIPAVWLTQAEAHARKPGFVRHGTSDPGRRSDPWPHNAPEAAEFLAYYKAARTTGRYANPSLPKTDPEDDIMIHWLFESPVKSNPTGKGHQFYYNPRSNETVHVQDGEHRGVLKYVAEKSGDVVKWWGERNGREDSSVVGDPRGFGTFNGPDGMTPVGTSNRPMTPSA